MSHQYIAKNIKISLSKNEHRCYEVSKQDDEANSPKPQWRNVFYDFLLLGSVRRPHVLADQK